MRTVFPTWLNPAAAIRHPAVLGTVIAGLTLCGLAFSVDLPRSAYGLKGDESTYYCMAYSLAQDGDLVYRRQDLARVWKEFPAGPEGIFLKRGKYVDVSITSRFPFLQWRTREDGREDRLYYGKSFVYPMVVAPFVRVFGTNGFLLFHALLLTACIAAGSAFLSARSAPGLAIGYSLVFLFCSAVPVYFVWLSPELFNYGLVFLGYFLWLYKEVAAGKGERGGWGGFLRSPWSDLLAAVLLGAVTFSKPIHVVLIVPLVLWAALGRRWRHGLVVAVVFLTVAGGLFAVNAAVTGEFNYQGGDRNTFYSSGGFPFQTDDLRYRSGEQRHSTNAVPFDSLVNRDALLTVFPHNLVYFLLGRHSGLAPYFFPAVVSSVLFLLARRTRERWQWLVAATILLAVVALLLYMPFTYSGGGGSLGNRYLLGFYPLFLFLTPPLKSAASAVTATVVGSVFTAQLIANPFYSSFYPAELPTRWPFRLLPIELSLLNDLPVDLTSARIKQPLGGRPPLLGYFLDSNAFLPAEDGAFWVRGESRTQIILRVPARELSNGSWEPLRVRWLRIELRMGDVENDVEASVGRSSRTVTAAAHATVVVTLDPGRGFPFRPMAERPTNELYVLTLSSRTGFVPMFTSGGADHRFLGVQVRVEPVYKP